MALFELCWLVLWCCFCSTLFQLQASALHSTKLQEIAKKHPKTNKRKHLKTIIKTVKRSHPTFGLHVIWGWSEVSEVPRHLAMIPPRVRGVHTGVMVSYLQFQFDWEWAVICAAAPFATFESSHPISTSTINKNCNFRRNSLTFPNREPIRL